jgi:hypothetical protein
MNINDNNIENISARNIIDPNFSKISPNKLKLNDPVIVYSNGINWKIVPLQIMFQYHTINDIYYDNNSFKDGNYIKSDITVVFCPYSLMTSYYFEKLHVSNFTHDNSLLFKKTDNTNYLISQVFDIFFSLSDKKFSDEYVRKNEVKIMTFRNALSSFPDSLYIHNVNIIKDSLPKSYKSNDLIYYPINDLKYDKYKLHNFHHKTVVYGIKYISKTDNTNKYSMIISNDVSININRFENSINKYNKYILSIQNKIRDRCGIITLSYLFAWLSFYPNSKIIKL